MNTLEQVLATLKILSKHSKTIISTRIPDIPHWEKWKASYYGMFHACGGIASLENYIKDGIDVEDGQKWLAVAVWGFKDEATMMEFLKRCWEVEATMKGLHTFLTVGNGSEPKSVANEVKQEEKS